MPAQESTPEAETPADPAVPATPPETPAPAPAITVQMTAATLADDCGGGPPPPAAPAKAKAKRSDMEGASSARMARVCEQTSMQLSVVAAAGAERSLLSVAKVELYDDKGALLGELTARAPSVWAEDGSYQTWDEAIDGGQELSVSYALSQPPWGDISDRRDRTYVLKAALTINGDEELVQREVEVAAPTILPPNVKT